MKRRKRKMKLALTAHLGGSEIRHDRRRDRLGSMLTLMVMLCVTILQAAHLVNPTTQINGTAEINQTALNDHFDDEPNFRLEFVNLKRQQVLPSTRAPQMISNFQISEAHQSRQLTLIKPQDQLERIASNSDESNQHLDDLLAVESNRSPVAVGQGQLKHQQAFVAPYEASGVLPRFQNSSSITRPNRDNTQSTQLISDNNSTQLLRLQPHAPLEPIYLKHNLPDHSQTPLKRQGQIVAFPHPSHTSPPAGFAGVQPQGSYALLPSWPNIYIAQRERTLAPASVATLSDDPKVPSNYPEWSLSSRARQHERENAAIQIELHRQEEGVRKRTNLTASEVEYSVSQEEKDDGNRKRSEQKSILTKNRNAEIESEDENNNNRNNNNNNKATASADSAQWARLLHQAANHNKQHPIKPLMFTNRSIISLFCDTHDMLIGLKFKKPFYGFVETNLDPLRQCRIFGNGSRLYEMRISLLDCGTRQEMPRLFINNIHIQFRSNNSKNQLREEASRQARLSPLEQLQLRELVDSRADEDGSHDELKTLVCSYPPPLPSQPALPSDSLRDEPASNSQVNAASNNLNFATDLTQQPARPPSVAFGGGRDTRARNNGTHNNATGAGGSELTYGKFDEFGRPLRPSDRIIDITSVDNPTSARSAYYEPILLISGLLLLAIACTLALISSAYLARRRAQQRRLKTSSNRFLPPRGAEAVDNRVYKISPSQLANRNGGSPLARPNNLVAPPLIGLTKEELLTKRPSGKKYSTMSKKQLRNASARSPAATSSKEHSRLDSRMAVKQHNAASESSSGTNDSLASSGAKRSHRTDESASTIEIPLASVGSEPAVAKDRDNQAATGSRHGGERPKATAAVGALRSTSNGKKVGPPEEEQSAATTREEYRREVSHERIVEKTTSYSRRSTPEPPLPPAKSKAQTATSDKQALHTKQEHPKKSVSPLPFGSFRSKLTSPMEYMRLQNISKLFGDSLTPARDDELHLRYRNRIARAMSDHERLNMRKLFQHDEVFKSNVVDSIDAETFWRKLRDNAKYAGKFSPAAWSLLQEIVLNPEMARPPSTTGSRLSRPGSTKLDEIFSTTSPSVSAVRASEIIREGADQQAASAHQPRGQPKVTNLDEGKFWRPGEDNPTKRKSLSKSNQETTPKPLLGLQLVRKDASVQAETSTQKAYQVAGNFKTESTDKRPITTHITKRMVSDQGDNRQKDTKTPGVRISQSNSTRARRDDGSTMINIDSITNITTPRNFSASTRSSFEQVTRYQEEDSLPYMDELSTQSSLDQDRHSFSSSSLDDKINKSRRR